MFSYPCYFLIHLAMVAVMAATAAVITKAVEAAGHLFRRAQH